MEVNLANKSRLDQHFKERQAQQKQQEDGSDSGDGMTAAGEVKAQVAQFWTRFNAIKSDAQEIVASAAAAKKEEPAGGAEGEPLRKLESAIQTAQKLVNDSTLFLSPYDIRTAQSTINGLTEELTKQREVMRPKKRFAFKSRQPSSASAEKPSAPPMQTTTEPTQSKPTSHAAAPDEEGFKDMVGQILVREASDKNDTADFSLTNLTECSIYISSPLRALRIYNLNKCKVFVGPVAGSVLLYNCKDCSFSLATQQLRIHDTTDTDFYLLVRSKPILENCNRVRFAPYNYSYPQFEEQLQRSLEVPVNLWNNVEDFNWPRIGEPSPHWTILPEDQRAAGVSPPAPPL